MNRYNPFRPGHIVTPGMFAGRISELITLEKALFQTKHGNPHHFLIDGERGIGKSSLLHYIQLVASGKINAPDAPTYKFLPIAVDLDANDEFSTIVNKIGVELGSVVSKLEAFKTLAKAGWDFLKRWEVMGVKYKSEAQDHSRDQLVNELCQTIAEALAKLGDEADGCFIFIDEADKPGGPAGLGACVKLLTERLTKQGIHHVTVGLAGVTGLNAKLRESHASAPRIFDNMRLEPLSEEDRVDVIQKGLDEAAEKNGFVVTIDDPASRAISSLSEGYPNFIQQFAFCAFDSDTDNVIDEKDVLDGAYKKNGAFDQLGHKYFSELYFDQIGSDEYRAVLRAMADHSDSWVTKAQLKKVAKEATLNNAITSLKHRGIILTSPGKKGVYRLPNKSFAVWIKAYAAGEGSAVAGDQVISEKGSDAKGLTGPASPRPPAVAKANPPPNDK